MIKISKCEIVKFLDSIIKPFIRDKYNIKVFTEVSPRLFVKSQLLI